MPLTVVVGGFHGDEGKGKIAAEIAFQDKAFAVLRAGSGPQAGHTPTKGVVLTQLPSGVLIPNVQVLIGQGTYLNPNTVLKEIREHNATKRVMIHPSCGIIEPHHIEAERESVERIGSVGVGTGPARVDRIRRVGKLAKDIPELQEFLGPVNDRVMELLARGEKVVVEGTQGLALSLFNEEMYPYVTSQDTTASQFLADAGLGPKVATDIVVVFKSYATRVDKQGNLKGEWSEEKREKMKGLVEHEKGSVSERKRRIAEFDPVLAVQAVVRNTATYAALTCIDVPFPRDNGIRDLEKLSKEARAFIDSIDSHLLEHTTQYRNLFRFEGIKIISTGRNLYDFIDLR